MFSFYISHVQNSRNEKLKQLHYYFVQSRDITDFCVSDVSASASRLRNFKILFFEEHCSLHSSLSILPFLCGWMVKDSGNTRWRTNINSMLNYKLQESFLYLLSKWQDLGKRNLYQENVILWKYHRSVFCLTKSQSGLRWKRP